VPSRVPNRLWIMTAALISGCPTSGVPADRSSSVGWTLAASLFLRLGWVALFLMLVPSHSAAQYPGQIANPNKNAPTLRAVAVLEWTGDAEHPKASRLVPVSVFDGQNLEDAGVYMSRPEPLALQSEVEYQLMRDGKPVGLFDVANSGQQQGSWYGFGKWKPLPLPKPANVQIAKIDEDDAQSDTPVLHRKHGSGDSGGGSSSGSGSGSGANGPPPDPDRPTLHKGGDASSSGSSSGSGSDTAGNSGGNSNGNSGSSGSTQASDPDRPTLHKGGDAAGGSSGSDSSSSNSGPPPDPDRPTLHRSDDSSSNTSANNSGQSKKKKNDEDQGYVEDVATVTDPERPHLFRGKAEGYGGPILPSLMGMPPEMQQMVAVSDAKNRPVHPWDYTWANPDDEAKMKAAMEDIARTALSLNPPPAPAAKPAPKTTTTRHKATKPAPAPLPAPLLDEQFHVFELAYGAGATMVLSARTDGSGGQQKFVTLIAQPDLYGSVVVLVKNVTDAAHLDDTPRMRLVDAVDATADNRGELLFELRGASQRQFALYRVLRGQATRIFLSGGDAIGTAAGE
jgi:hypothetical protein